MEEGIKPQNEGLKELINRYEELENQADETYESVKKVHEFPPIGQGWDLGSIKPADEVFESMGSTGIISSFRENEKQADRDPSTAVSNVDNSSKSTKNEFIITQNIKDKATADYANNDLVNKFQEKGLGGGFR
jgi:hypothetical protein